MKRRGQWQGMMAIIRFNWPLYVAAVGVAALALGVIIMVDGWFLKIAGALSLAGSLYFLIISSAVSHWIYDRSDLYQWKWLGRALGDGRIKAAIICHAGFDEVSANFRELFPDVVWRVLDHYDGARTTEPSIGRARRLFPPTAGTLSAPFDRWPVADETADVVFGLLAVHELRTEDERAAWFAEAGRCLRPGGRVVVAEHTRDLANFLAFGPGFMHFHSSSSWRRCWEIAGLVLSDGFRVTPWIRIFVLARS